MRILAAMDKHSYSAGIAGDLAKLAANTWADIIMLGVQQGGTDKLDESLAATLFKYQEKILGQMPAEDSPYAGPSDQQMIATQNGAWEASSRGKKELTLKVRAGDATKEILAEAREREIDLIILGCSKGGDCEWEGEMNLPQKIARDADCSVLVIKEEKIPDKITCCLDQAHVSQDSLEMINQIVTLHQADLKIVGLTGPKGLTGKNVETKMNEVLKYYTARGINTFVKLVDSSALENYVKKSTTEGLIALWVGKESLLSKIFSKNLIGKLVATGHSSVLILR